MIHLLPIAEQLASFDLGPRQDFYADDAVVIGETADGIPIVRQTIDGAPSDLLTLRACPGIELDVDDGTLRLSLDGHEGVALTAEQWTALRRLVAVEPAELIEAAQFDAATDAVVGAWKQMRGRFMRLWSERLGFQAWLDLTPAARTHLLALSDAIRAADMDALRVVEPALDAFSEEAREVIGAWLLAEAEWFDRPTPPAKPVEPPLPALTETPEGQQVLVLTKQIDALLNQLAEREAAEAEETRVVVAPEPHQLQTQVTARMAALGLSPDLTAAYMRGWNDAARDIVTEAAA